MPSTLTRPQRSRALRTALRDAQSIGPFSIPVVIGLLAGFTASFAADALLYDLLGTPWRQFVDAAVFAMVAAPVWLTVQRTEVRALIDRMREKQQREIQEFERKQSGGAGGA